MDLYKKIHRSANIEGDRMTINVKRSCESNIRHYDGDRRLAFNSFTINIDQLHYDKFMIVHENLVKEYGESWKFEKTLAMIIAHGEFDYAAALVMKGDEE